jgi:MYXO-CTERM domain-containing protein
MAAEILMKAPFLVPAALAGAALASILLPACGAGTDEGGSPAATASSDELGHAASALTVPHPLRWDGLLPGMRAFRPTPQHPPQSANPVCANPKLSYFGGPLLQSPTIVAVFWTSSVNATLQANIGQFYADVMQSPYWSFLHEYDSVGLSPGTQQAILPGTSGGNFVITPLKCAPGGANCKLTDLDVQNELTRQINLGVLPAPTVDCTGQANTIYMVDFPPNISLGGPFGVGKSCVNNGFCAYHNTGTYGPNNLPLIYGANMDVFTGPCSLGCGADPTPLDTATDLHSHELVEAVTDPDIGLDLQANYAFPAGWGDNFNMCGEIADICADGSPGDTITVSGRTWYVQQLWSNAQHKCTSSGPSLTICSGTTVTGCRKCSCGDNGGACGGSTSVCETTSGNVLFGACEQCTATSGTCTAGTCQQSATPSLDDICANCTPKTCAQLGANCGKASDGCGGVLDCGTCAAPQICGGGTPGTPNQCGTCTPTTTCPGGFDCGAVSDGCGGMITCGVCTAPQTCGGGAPGKPNVCGCTPKTTCPAGDDCGTLPDGCGGVIACGTCPAPQTCGTATNPNQCSGCLPKTTCPAGFDCGTFPDGCGGQLSCGNCAAPEICGGGANGSPNVCGCTPADACPFGAGCGTVPDGCGGTLFCGSCGDFQVCSGNQCVSTSTGTGASASSGGAGGTGGAGGAETSGGTGGWIPLYGRGGCYCGAAPGDVPGWPAGALGLVGLAGLGARRRRSGRRQQQDDPS